MKTILRLGIILMAVAIFSNFSNAQSPIFTPGMTIVPFGTVDAPAAEGVEKAIDGDLGSKFLNFTGNVDGSGFDVDLGKLAIANKIELTYGNDAAERDPASVIIYGSTDGTTFVEVVTIASLGCDYARDETRSYDFENTTEYSHYRVHFDTKCDAGQALFQIMEVQLYDGSVFIPENPVVTSSMSIFPYSDATPRWGDSESVYAAFDGNVDSKWLDQDKTGAYTGFTIDLDGLSVAANQLMVTTAMSAGEDGRDPAAYEVLGSTDGVTYTPVATGAFTHTADRGANMYVTFTNTTAYSFYSIAFTSTHEGGQLCQVGEVQLYSAEPGVQSDSKRTSALNADVIAFDGDIGGEYSADETVVAGFDNNVKTKWFSSSAADGIGAIIDLGEKNVIAQTLRITTANDAPERDATSYKVSGSTDGVTYVEIGAGDIPTSDNRFLTRDFALTNTATYSFYKVEFPTIKAGDNFQIQNIELLHEGTVTIVELPWVFLPGMNVEPFGPSFSWGEVFGVTESPDKAFDNDENTKFFNGAPGTEGTIGITVDLDIYSAVAKKLVLKTANDDPGRDPLSYEVFGSNDGVNFTSIATGDIAVNFDRFSKTTYDIDNTESYSYYRITFPTRHDENKPFQIAEANLLHDGNLTALESKKLFLTENFDIKAFETNDSPDGEGVSTGVDNNWTTKWLDFAGGANGSGFTVSFENAVVTNALVYVSGNDAPDRDANSFVISGSNDSIDFIEIANVAIPNSDLRGYSRTFEFTNTTAYSYYKVSFPAVKNPGQGLFQVMDIQLLSLEVVPYYDLSFNVKDDDGAAIAGASVAFMDETLTTDIDGVVVFAQVALVTDEAYSVSMAGYESVNATVSVVDADVSVDVVLSLITYSVSFNVVGTDASAIEGASVVFNNETISTDASGVAVFSNVAPVADATYTVTISGYEDYTNTLSVVDADVAEDVILMSVGVADMNYEMLTVYPNPTQGKFIVTVGEAFINGSMTIYNTIGGIVEIRQITSTHMDCDLISSKKGIYFIKITSEQSSKMQKVIIE